MSGHSCRPSQNKLD